VSASTFEPDRRAILGWSAAAAMSAALGLRARASVSSARRFVAQEGSAIDLKETLHWVMTTPRDPAMRRGAREMHAGLDPGHLLGAVLVAASRDIRTDQPTVNHAVLSVSAIDQLTRSASVAERERGALLGLDFFKAAQAAEALHDDWRMAPLEAAKIPSGTQARAALVDALERWDREAADVAIAGFVRSAPLDEVWAVVWEYALRCSQRNGHKVIHSALSRRALPLAGERYAEDVLRAVVAMLFSGGRSSSADAFETSRGLVKSGLAVRPDARATDGGPARELLAELRTSKNSEMPEKTAALIRGGAAPAALWDAIVTAACEVAVAEVDLGPLHAVTSTNSVHYIARNAPNARVELLALLQGAAWVVEFRRHLTTDSSRVRIDALEADESTLDEVLVPERRTLTNARGALGLAARDAELFLGQCRAASLAKDDDIHEIKLAAAALEEARCVSTSVRPYACAALSVYVPSPQREDGETLCKIRDARAMASAR
jgi:hypothetical protein